MKKTDRHRRIKYPRILTLAISLAVLIHLPGPVQAGGELLRSVEVDGEQRSYLLYVPAEYDGARGWPLLISFHGFGQSAEDMRDAAEDSGATDDAGFLVAYPYGLDVTDVLFGGSASGWNVPGGYSGNQDDLAFTDRLIDDIGADYSVDPLRVHVTGFSNGSEMAFYLACELPDRIASVAGASGGLTYTLLNSCQPMRPISVLVIFGTDDEYYPFLGNDSTPPVLATPLFFASYNNCSVEPTVTDLPNLVPTDNSTVTVLEYGQCDPEIEVLFYRINGGDHASPAFNQDINAISVMLGFFERNPMPTSEPLIGGRPIAGQDDWFLSDWFGTYGTTFAPWIYHAEHGFLYRDPGSTNESMFAYDDAMGTWCWTNEAVYPFIYAYDPPADNAGTDVDFAWLFYFEGTKSPRSFGVLTGANAGQILFFGP